MGAPDELELLYEGIGVPAEPERRGMVAGEVLTERVCRLKPCYNLQGKYGAMDVVGANVASGGGGDSGRLRYSYNRYNMINLQERFTKLLQENGYHITQYN